MAYPSIYARIVEPDKNLGNSLYDPALDLGVELDWSYRIRLQDLVNHNR